MPEISRFFGIVISMLYNDHAPPHFHVRYGEHEASVNILNVGLREGRLPQRVLGLVAEWASLHREESILDGERARRGRPLARIAPLE